jgi:putative ABC transport system permease protein
MLTLKRIFWYHLLTGREIVRQPGLLLIHVVIVAGICLPLVILAGLKRGHVDELRQQLVSSPTGRQITFWSAQNGPLLTNESMQQLTESLPNVDLIIPEVRAVVGASSATPSETFSLKSLTLHATAPSDPILQQHRASISDETAQEIVLSASAAEQLQVAIGGRIELKPYRNGRQDAAIPFVVSGVFGERSDASTVGFVSVPNLTRIQRYVGGFAVPKWQLPVKDRFVAADQYPHYLIYCKADDALTDQDLRLLGESLDVVRVEDSNTIRLFGLLKPSSTDDLKVYRASARPGVGKPVPLLTTTPTEIDEITSADDVVFAWTEPLTEHFAGQRRRLVGISLGKHKWFRQYVEMLPALFAFGDDELQFQTNRSSDLFVQAEATLEVSDRTRIVLTGDVVADASPSIDETANADNQTEILDDGGIESVWVPAPLLAHIVAMRRGEAVFDPTARVFSPVPEKQKYDKARLYAATIDGVPPIVEELVRLKFAHYSESTRIAEIKGQDESLSLLVTVVAGVVTLFGVLTVTIVLVDSTSRRKRDIGILRIIGVSSEAVLYMIVARAFMIGIAAAFTAWGAGELVCRILEWQPADTAGIESLSSLLKHKPVTSAVLDVQQDWMIGVVAVACSVAGSLLPGILAGRLAPFDALVSGKES